MVDPAPERSEAQKAADAVAAERLKALRAVRKPQPAPIPVQFDTTSVLVQEPALEPEVRHPACRRHRPVWRLACPDCNGEAPRDVPSNWSAVADRVKLRGGRRCRHCGSRERLSVHHIVPRSQGDTHDPRNLITLCDTCHDVVEQPGEPA